MSVKVLHFLFQTNEPRELGEFPDLPAAELFCKQVMTLDTQRRGTFAIQAGEKIIFQPHQFTLSDGTILRPEIPAMFRIIPYPLYPLTEKAEPFTPEEIKETDLHKLVSLMLFTAYGAPGCGLAAPQIGISKQIFVMDPDLATTGIASPTVILNPSLSNLGPLEPMLNEGCLSVPGIRHDTHRAADLQLTGMNLAGEEVSFYFDGWSAAVVQHEYDHLQGKIFLDTLSPLKRDLYKNKLKKANKKAERYVRQMNEYEQKKKALLNKEERRICDMKQTIIQTKLNQIAKPSVTRKGLPD